MFGIGGFELFLILLFAFLIFGPDKLPQVAQTVGKAIAKFRSAQEEVKEQLSLDSLIKQEDAASNKNGAFKTESSSVKAPSASESAAPSSSSVRSSSFAERKAQYDKERAQRKAEQTEVKTVSASDGASDTDNPRSNVPEKKPIDASSDFNDKSGE